MMNNNVKRTIAWLLAAALSAAMLSGCTNDSGADWDDTLPSAVTTTGERSAEIIEEDTNPPVSISMPDKTTASERNTELATTTATYPEDEETESSTARYSTISGISTVPSGQLTTSYSYSSSTSTLFTGTTASSSASDTATAVSGYDISDVFTATGSSTSETTASSVITKQSADEPYIFNDPRVRPYAYSTLDERLKGVYDILINAITKHYTKTSIPSSVELTPEEYTMLYQMIYDSEYSIFYVSTQMKYTTKVSTKTISEIEFVYTYTKDEVASMQEQIDTAVNKIIGGITEDMSEYQIVKYFYDTLAGGVVYDENAANLRDIYGAFVDKACVCGGYAKAFSYLCDKVGIESLTITGDFDEVPHMWNMVKLDDDWYHLDPTAGNVDNSTTPYVRYDYFCCSDEFMKNSHVAYDQEYSYPKASADKYNYFVYNSLVADSVESAEKLISEKILEAASKGEKVIQFSCSTDEVFDEVVYYLFDKSKMNALTIYENNYDEAERKYNYESIVYNQNKETRVIKLFIDYLD
jgi:transglutaminase/protease-like cytokinesis protein 3